LADRAVAAVARDAEREAKKASAATATATAIKAASKP